MKKILQIGLALMLFMGLVLGATAQVKSDYDKNTDFSKYKTYTFEGWQKDSDQQLNDFDKKRIQDALKSEFSKRGMTYVESGGDAAIAIFLVLDKKTSTTAYTNYMGGMGYGPRWGWGGGMGNATTTYSEDDYIEGTLVVDMYDATGKSLLWQGVMTKTVNEKPEKREKTIPKNIAKLMKQYPVSPVK